MKGDSELLTALLEDEELCRISRDSLATDYDSVVERFYSHFAEDTRQIFLDDALYHKLRYLDMLGMTYRGRVLELGSDKPLITHMLRILNPDAQFATVSVDLPHSPYDIHELDIETERLPFEDDTFEHAIFTEVLEHLFRDPAWAVKELNRVLAPKGELLLTTPNACGADVAQNLVFQANPNLRNQFYPAIESGHPHLWTPKEVRLLLEASAFSVDELTTVDYHPMEYLPRLLSLLREHSPAPELHQQVIRVIARKVGAVASAAYPPELFPLGHGVRLEGALRRWVIRELKLKP